jgi:membrane-associated protein
VTETLMRLVGEYGPLGLSLILAISCLGVPIPASLLMLASGSLVAEGDMDLWPVLGFGIIGAVVGDQGGYLIGRIGGSVLVHRLADGVGAAAALQKAEGFADRWGAPGVFLTRWLLSPLGPYVNLVGGMVGMSWLKFTAWGVAGEIVWVTKYVLIGMTFSQSIQAIADVLGDLTWFLVGALITGWLGWMLVKTFRRPTPVPGAGG